MNMLNDSQIQEIIRLHEAGHSRREIAETLGISKTTVQNYVSQHEQDELSKLEEEYSPRYDPEDLPFDHDPEEDYDDEEEEDYDEDFAEEEDYTTSYEDEPEEEDTHQDTDDSYQNDPETYQNPPNSYQKPYQSYQNPAYQSYPTGTNPTQKSQSNPPMNTEAQKKAEAEAKKKAEKEARLLKQAKRTYFQNLVDYFDGFEVYNEDEFTSNMEELIEDAKTAATQRTDLEEFCTRKDLDYEELEVWCLLNTIYKEIRELIKEHSHLGADEEIEWDLTYNTKTRIQKLVEDGSFDTEENTYSYTSLPRHRRRRK